VRAYLDPSSQDDEEGYIHNPDFPQLPATVPLTYTLTMVACLSGKPEERPTFGQLVTVLADVEAEVTSGCYLNSEGAAQVRLIAYL
jgi:hypothetical protein